jgi:transcriptional regulator with XRE-family HTH domain
MSKFAIRLKETRIDRYYTEERLCEEAHIPLKSYLSYENTTVPAREPDFDTLIRIATVLDVSADYLLGITNVRAM